MKALLSKIAFIFSCALSPLVQASPPELILRSFVGDHLSWRLEVSELTGLMHQRCGGRVFKGKDTSLVALTVPECAELQELLKHKVTLRSEKFRRLDDEPRYEFEILGTRYAVGFTAPESCQIQKAGSLKCKRNELTDLQSALLILRAKAPKRSS
jgi:hypothetical protein